MKATVQNLVNYKLKWNLTVLWLLFLNQHCLSCILWCNSATVDVCKIQAVPISCEWNDDDFYIAFVPCLYFVVNHSTPQTISLGISKTWSTIFTFIIHGDIRKFVQIRVYIKKTIKLSKCWITLPILKTKKCRPHLGKLIRLITLFVIYQLSQIEDDIHDVSQLSCLLGHIYQCLLLQDWDWDFWIDS